MEGETRVVANELEKRFLAVTRVANDHELIRLVSDFVVEPASRQQLNTLANPVLDEPTLAPTRAAFLAGAGRAKLQDYVDLLMADPLQPKVASWILLDAQGTNLAAAFDTESAESPIGKNFAYRTYFHGGPRELPTSARPKTPVRDTHISTVFLSTATLTRKVAITTPIFQGTDVLGVVGMTVELGEFVRFPTSANQCAILVDAREGQEGIVIEHSFFSELKRDNQPLPKLEDFRVDLKPFRQQGDTGVICHDPFGEHPAGGEYRGKWIANAASVKFERLQRNGQISDYDAKLMMIVQQRTRKALAPVKRLSVRMFREGLAAVFGFLVVTAASWTVVVNMLKSSTAPGLYRALPPMDNSTVHSRETLELPFPDRR